MIGIAAIILGIVAITAFDRTPSKSIAAVVKGFLGAETNMAVIGRESTNRGDYDVFYHDLFARGDYVIVESENPKAQIYVNRRTMKVERAAFELQARDGSMSLEEALEMAEDFAEAKCPEFVQKDVRLVDQPEGSPSIYYFVWEAFLDDQPTGTRFVVGISNCGEVAAFMVLRTDLPETKAEVTRDYAIRKAREFFPGMKNPKIQVNLGVRRLESGKLRRVWEVNLAQHDTELHLWDTATILLDPKTGEVLEVYP